VNAFLSQVQESDLHENDWLLVFMEMVFLQEKSL
jgi:hypothetical protein